MELQFYRISILTEFQYHVPKHTPSIIIATEEKVQNEES